MIHAPDVAVPGFEGRHRSASWAGIRTGTEQDIGEAGLIRDRRVEIRCDLRNRPLGRLPGRRLTTKSLTLRPWMLGGPLDDAVKASRGPSMRQASILLDV